MKGRIRYTRQSATENQIRVHLEQTSGEFVPALDGRVDIREYAVKLFARAVIFEAWSDALLVGIVAAYTDHDRRSAFITNVSVLKDFSGLGIASSLVGMCIDYAKENRIGEITLEVSDKNDRAIALYEKLNFVRSGTRGGSIVMRRPIDLDQ